MAQVFEESVRLDLAFNLRRSTLTERERAYAENKIQRCDELAKADRWSDLLLELIALVEDAETLGTRNQEPLVARTLFIRDRLKDLLASPLYAEFTQGRRPVGDVLREALCLAHGNKKAAVGLLDEAIRVPFGWIKSLPPKALPGSLALENFLLPGNKEDGADKSRHWNVFGGLSLYKSPQQSLDLALRREMKDLREGKNSPEAMTEFLRDTIANLNGIYYVVSMDPFLLYTDTGH